MGLGQEIALIKALGGGSSLPSVSSSDNGKVLCVGPNGWEAANIDNTDRQIWIYATIGNDGSISTMSTVSYEALGQLNGGFTLVARINDEYEFSLAAVYLSKKEVTDAFFVFEGTYLDILALKQKSFIVAIPIPSPGSSSNVVIAWKEDKFIVTLTPTSPDYSGTMDKTVAEIWNAHNSGQDIVFRFMMGETEYYDVIPNLFQHVDGVSYGCISASAIIATNTFAEIRTVQSVSDGNVNNYYAHIYTLTPAS